MKRTLCMTAAAVLLSAGVASAQTTLLSQNITAVVNVGNQARLIVTGGPVTFADSDPDTVPSIPAGTPVSVTARARVTPATQLQVMVRATESFFDMGTDTIAASALSWTASAGFSGGTMSTADQALATWTGPSNQSGTQNYALANAWTYTPGTHDLTLVYTLVTP